jgi:ABC-2 type transport system permease protein
MRAMIVKEFRQLRRDRRTLAMMIVMPVVLRPRPAPGRS